MDRENQAFSISLERILLNINKLSLNLFYVFDFFTIIKSRSYHYLYSKQIQHYY
jgi:hypothetical protein